MKVLLVGYPKTGTKSMTSALSKLGYVVYDFTKNFHYLGNDWLKIFKEGGTKEDFYRMYKDVDASCDSPAYLFWEEIMEAFPDMKLILTRRDDENEWFKSVKKQTETFENNFQMKALTFLSSTARSLARYSHHINSVTVCGKSDLRFYQYFDGISPTLAKRMYRTHNTSVLMRAPKDQLLEFDLRDGWKPLCQFLSKPIPDEPFPHLNKKGEIAKKINYDDIVMGKILKEAKISLAVIIVAIGIGIYWLLCWIRLSS